MQLKFCQKPSKKQERNFSIMVAWRNVLNFQNNLLRYVIHLDLAIDLVLS